MKIHMKLNFNYLMYHVAKELHTIVRQYSAFGVPLEEICGIEEFSDLAYLTDPDKSGSLIDLLISSPEKEYPKIYTGSCFVTYSCVTVEESYFIVGPVVLDGNMKSEFRLPSRNYSPEWLISLYHCDTEKLVNELLLLHNLFRTEPKGFHETAAFNCLGKADKNEVFQTFSNILFENIEESSHHNPYDQEVREVSSIRSGNLEQLKKSWEEDYTGNVGQLAKTKIRSYKNLGIVLVTLGCRAAIEGGVHPEIAYTLSDSYIRKIEEAVNPVGAVQLGRQAEYQYTVMVHEIRSSTAGESHAEQNPYIDKCKDYIFAHLHDKIRVPDIAEALYLNPNYLSNLFKKEVGMTLSQYIWKEKLNLVKNMLIYSQYSQSEIAAYLGFCSQSHLGRLFKKETGMTMDEYRSSYGVREFQV